MTTDAAPIETNDEGNNTEDFLGEANDPMLAALKEEAADEGKGAEGQDGVEGQQDKPAGNEPDKQPEAPKTQDDGGKQQPVMIPKARLDEVLRENSQLKDALAYKDGIIHTQKDMIEGKGKPPETGDQGKTDAPKPDDPATKIAKAEEDILALAQKYEDGEISLVEYEKGKLDLNRQIRALDDERIKSVTEIAKRTATETVVASNRQITLETEAVKIQEAHPYIAEIDKLPKARADAAWTMITAEAYDNLAAKGINPNDGKLESRLELVKEKAALTEKYGPTLTGKTLAGQQGKEQKPLSDIAKQRQDKLNLSEQQPPPTANANYGADRPALTEQDIEKMTDDQLADLEVSNPGLLEKTVGLTQR